MKPTLITVVCRRCRGYKVTSFGTHPCNCKSVNEEKEMLERKPSDECLGIAVRRYMKEHYKAPPDDWVDGFDEGYLTGGEHSVPVSEEEESREVKRVRLRCMLKTLKTNLYDTVNTIERIENEIE